MVDNINQVIAIMMIVEKNIWRLLISGSWSLTCAFRALEFSDAGATVAVGIYRQGVSGSSLERYFNFY